MSNDEAKNKHTKAKKYKSRDNSNSVTRFGEILPLWQNFKNIWQRYEGLISIWQSFEPTLENSVCFWANLGCCKWQNIEQIFYASGHTVTATTTRTTRGTKNGPPRADLGGNFTLHEQTHSRAHSVCQGTRVQINKFL